MNVQWLNIYSIVDSLCCIISTFTFGIWKCLFMILPVAVHILRQTRPLTNFSTCQFTWHFSLKVSTNKKNWTMRACPKSKDPSFTVLFDKEKLQILTFKKMRTSNPWKSDWNHGSIAYQSRWKLIFFRLTERLNLNLINFMCTYLFIYFLPNMFNDLIINKWIHWG